jgi:hypothetical protein
MIEPLRRGMPRCSTSAQRDQSRLQSEINNDCTDPQDKNERHSKRPEAVVPICPVAPQRFVSKIFYFLFSETNVLKFIWRTIRFVKLIQPAT